MTRSSSRLFSAFAAFVSTGIVLAGCGGGGNGSSSTRQLRALSTFSVPTQTGPNGAGQIAEIVAASPDGNTLVYTDSPARQVGFVNIQTPSQPQALGAVQTPGEPTSVAVTRDGQYALAVISGDPDILRVYNLATRAVVRDIALGGQPDSIAISPDGRYAAVAIENERQDSDNPPPQLPSGFLTIVNLSGDVAAWTTRDVQLTGLSNVRFPSDAEPEFVDINSNNVAAVTLQENNAVVLVNLAGGTVVRSFSAGTTTHLADTQENNNVAFTDNFSGRREPDGIAWTPSGNLITANEGDLDTEGDVFAGGRNATVFSPTGQVLLDINDIEARVNAAGLYDDDRSENRGVEPENVEVARLGGGTYAFVAIERAAPQGAVLVYRLSNNDRRAEFVQALPTGVSPEGVLAIPGRNLLVSANEVGGSLSIFGL